MGEPLMTTKFKNAVVDAVLQPVKSKLENVLEQNSKTYTEICNHELHAVEQYNCHSSPWQQSPGQKE